MTREKKVTVRFSDQELSELTEQIQKEERNSVLPAAMKGVAQGSTLSAFIRERSLRADRGKELKRIRLALTRMETMMQQISTYLERNPKTGQNGSSVISFMELCRELQEVREQIERMNGDGSNGTETH